MRILFDAHMVGERETGNETYAVNLLSALAQIDDDTEFIVAAAHPEALAARVPASRRFRTAPVSASPVRRLVSDLPRIARQVSADILHVTYAGPPLGRTPLVVTIHDVAYKRNPSWFSLRDRAVLSCGIAWTAPRAARIITVSEHAKTEICEALRAPPERVVVTLEAAAPHFRPLDAAERRAFRPERWGIRGPYVLAAGNLQPRKNIRRLVEAFARLDRRCRPHHLVVAGQARWRESDIHDTVRREGIEDFVVFTGYVADDDLVGLMNGADTFVYPSLYEGFGLPVIEAMACGAPIITSNTSSLPEVAGDAALLVYPHDTAAIAEALDRVLGDPHLRSRMARASLGQAARFSWRRTAEETLEVYRQIAAAARAPITAGRTGGGRVPRTGP